MCTELMRALSYTGAEKITFPPKSDGTDRRADISNYRVASQFTISGNVIKLVKVILYIVQFMFIFNTSR